MSEYDSVQKGGLRLKGVSDGGVKKKKKKRKDKESQKTLKQITTGESSQDEIESSYKAPRIEKRTRAELAYLKVKEKRNEQQLLERASKTHKERIMEFNKNLDNLTEHFDIPKVSWTK